MVKIHSGILKGKKIFFPKGKLRVTQDKIRKAIFDIIGNEIKEKSVLDLFAGSGSFGITALSFGAKEVYFVEKDKKVFQYLKRNINQLENCYSYLMDVFIFLKKIDKKFDIIFLDPPYFKNYYKRVLNLIRENNLLNKKGFIIVESHKRFDFKDCNFKILKEKIYGDTKITILGGGNEENNLSGKF
ncbi:MAG: 16S rRNA (guanine(966)-N(2))-methyltransferase RsmD [candidate division WOR-3 bacterium]|nr:16S rRNA (guanine(966)-N(2))-methyltransferase RsmD [candidate division WOR-3 bacterium]